MAGRIAGITIEIGGDTTKLQSALKGVDKQLRDTQSSLKDINKLLKLDPGNTELLTQKQKQLENAIDATKERLAQLKDAQNGVAQGSAEWDALQREIIATEQSLKQLETEYRNFGSVAAQQIKAAGQGIQDFGGKVSEAGKNFQPISTAAAGALTALGGLAYKTVTAADDLNALSQQTGLSTDELQKMQYASDLVDVSLEDMTGALKKTKSSMTGNAETWERLGVSVTNADGSMRNATDVFYDTLEALSNVENETERDQLAMEIFGKSADQLAGIIDDGGASLKEYGKQAEDLGMILDEETLDSLNQINDTIDELKANAGGTLAKLGATLAKTLAPALKKVVGFMDKVSDKLSKLTPEQAETILKIVGIVAAIGPLLTVGGKIIKLVGSLVSVIGTVVGVLGGPLTIAIGAVIAIGVTLYKNWDTVKEKAKQLKDGIVKAWDNIKTSVTDAVNNVKTAVTTAWDNIKTTTSTAWDNVKSAVTTRVDSVKTSVSTAFGNIKTNVSNTWENLKSTTSAVWGTIQSDLSSRWASIKSAYEQHGGGLKGIASATVEGIKQYFSLGFDALNTITGGKLEAVKNAISTVFDKIKSIVTNVVDAIKNAFNFDWKLPHIKLPHFTVTGGQAPYGLGGQGYLPSISVSWYKKAYDNPVMFTSPTVLNTPGGYKGFGDHGAEIVLGLNKLRELVGSAGDVIINVYGAPGQNVNELADAVQARLVALQRQKEAAYA